jgi:glutamate dehydrogenase
LTAYFPRRLRESYAEHFAAHALRREIVATMAVNHLINNAGITFLERLTAWGKSNMGEEVKAYLEVDRAAGAEALRQRVQDAGLDAAREQEALLEIEDTLEERTRAALEGKTSGVDQALQPLRKRLAL